MTKKPRKIFGQQCGTRRIIELLSPKWRTLILCALGDEKQRYNELLACIEGVSQKMLTSSLKGMERDGLIERIATAPNGRRVEYTLTGLGRSAHARLRDLCTWAEAHVDELGSTRAPSKRNRYR